MRPIDADALRETIIKGENISSLEYHLTKQYEYIENAPTVEPKIGHWIEYKPDYHRCSNCNKDAFVKWSPSKRDNVDVLTDYCPNCGARMVEPQESEE